MIASKAQRIRELEAKIENMNGAHAQVVRRLTSKLHFEQLGRMHAQRGLVPYVAAVEALNAWLTERPELLRELEPILKELGLAGVKVGYNPDKDLAQSVVSVNRA